MVHPSPTPSTSTAPPTEPTSRSSSSSPRRTAVSPAPDSLDYALLSGLAGGIAGCVGKTSVAPLDRVKILFQTRSPDYARYAGTWMGVFRASKDIYAETGVRGLLQGHSATLLRIFPYAAIKFMAYEKIHIILMPTADVETSTKRFLAGSLAGVTSALLTYPLELIRVRLAFEPRHNPNDKVSVLKTIRQIYLEPPLPLTPPSKATAAPSPPPIPSKPTLTHFYRGIFPTLFGIIPYAGTSFVVWGFLRTDLLPTYLSADFRQRHRAWLDLMAGGIAGALGQTAAYPLDIIRRRMQVGPATLAGAKGRAGFWETAKGVYKVGGWRGFFVGLSIGYLKVVPMNATSFATWEALKTVFGLEKKGRGEG
ncbi:mitochondrial carrier domain-containing protein [Leucosporidium creatinivorum]|uniref:Mitochondrial carrier domain-containing protein n=1 Tax=Leucosporidium creatinivorum TaxID=106004 RepID=A0A1Y2FXE0_9BASI|nr:mitochondrial carrier domain-containing protein [Leucosporidium creatinivorum]